MDGPAADLRSIESLLELGGAMRALGRLERHRREAMRTIFGRRRSRRRRLLHPVNLLDEQKDRECDNQEI